MAQNLPADPNLTLEQDTYLRIKYLGALIQREGIRPDYFSEQSQLTRTEQVTNDLGQRITVRNPIVTLGLTFQLDPLTVFDAIGCNRAIHPSVLSIQTSTPAPSCDPALGGAELVDPAFGLPTLVDSALSVPLDQNNEYVIEG